MRALLSALSSALLPSLPTHADDLQQVGAVVAATPQDQFSLAGARSTGDFVYGTHVSGLDHAALAPVAA